MQFILLTCNKYHVVASVKQNNCTSLIQLTVVTVIKQIIHVIEVPKDFFKTSSSSRSVNTSQKAADSVHRLCSLFLQTGI